MPILKCNAAIYAYVGSPALANRPLRSLPSNGCGLLTHIETIPVSTRPGFNLRCYLPPAAGLV